MGTNLREYRQKKKVTVQTTAKAQRTSSPMSPSRGGERGRKEGVSSPIQSQCFQKFSTVYISNVNHLLRELNKIPTSLFLGMPMQSPLIKGDFVVSSVERFRGLCFFLAIPVFTRTSLQPPCPLY